MTQFLLLSDSSFLGSIFPFFVANGVTCQRSSHGWDGSTAWAGASVAWQSHGGQAEPPDLRVQEMVA